MSARNQELAMRFLFWIHFVCGSMRQKRSHFRLLELGSTRNLSESECFNAEIIILETKCMRRSEEGSSRAMSTNATQNNARRSSLSFGQKHGL